jgi:hypothetical protein
LQTEEGNTIVIISGFFFPRYIHTYGVRIRYICARGGMRKKGGEDIISVVNKGAQNPPASRKKLWRNQNHQLIKGNSDRRKWREKAKVRMGSKADELERNGTMKAFGIESE